MSLSSAIAALASRLATEFNTLRGELSSGLSGKANTSHSHAGADISSGTVAFARLPTGSSSSQVAVGNHTHSYLDQTAGDARYRQHNQAPRTQSASANANIDVGAAGDLHVTATASVTLTPTNGQNGRTCVVEVLASGAARTITIGGSPLKGEGVAAASLAIPSGGRGRFLIRYTTLGGNAYSVDSCYLVA